MIVVNIRMFCDQSMHSQGQAKATETQWRLVD